ncbi:MAG TPA: long-chain fatty acid transport protein, partial [Dehalococcoidia bacterium]|nr:long-chain fatty acid transport protein [Dehalococcoidia bacterium]
MRSRLAVAVVLCCLAAPDTAAAQDSNYWTIQYGNRARLLGGSAVGSASDLSAVYYNPGRLA